MRSMPATAASCEKQAIALARAAAPSRLTRSCSPASSTIAAASAPLSPGRHDDARLPVGDDLRQPTDAGDDRCPAALGGLERDHPEPFATGRDDDDRAPLVERRHRSDAAEEGDALGRRRAKLAGERAVAGDLERELGDLLTGECKRLQQDVETLDRDQPAHGEEPRLGRGWRRLGTHLDAVVDDGERRAVETLGGGEVVGETGGDRDLPMCQPPDRPIGGCEESVRAELVEAVLRADADWIARERGGRKPEQVGVHEVGVHDRRVRAHELGKGERVEVEAKPALLDRDAARSQPRDELRRTRFALVQHEHAGIPAPRTERG